MSMDDRKQRIMMAIVSLYANDGEPVGSNLLSRHFNMAVSSATLRNEMAALTRLGLLEQPIHRLGACPRQKGTAILWTTCWTRPKPCPRPSGTKSTPFSAIWTMTLIKWYRVPHGLCPIF